MWACFETLKGVKQGSSIRGERNVRIRFLVFVTWWMVLLTIKSGKLGNKRGKAEYSGKKDQLEDSLLNLGVF